MNHVPRRDIPALRHVPARGLADGLHAEKNLAHALKLVARNAEKVIMQTHHELDSIKALEKALRYAQRLGAIKGTREVLKRRKIARARILALCGVLGLRATRQDVLVFAIADLHKRATMQSPAI
jgi:hypothetical protein